MDGGGGDGYWRCGEYKMHKWGWGILHTMNIRKERGFGGEGSLGGEAVNEID